MDNHPMVSICMPVYNGGVHLQRAIRSVLNQTYTNFEFIITDDGSTDQSLEIIRSFDDPRIKIIRDGSNRGIGNRLNEQVRTARGRYFARMDADDLMFPTRIEEQVNYLTLHADIDVVGSSAVVMDEHDNIRGIRLMKAEYSFQDAIKGAIFIHPSIMGKIEWFRKTVMISNTMAQKIMSYLCAVIKIQHSET